MEANRHIWSQIRTRGVCVTGTDTGVGKTWVSGALAYFLRKQSIPARVFKPMQTGREELMSTELDSAILKDFSGEDVSEALICPYTFDPPVAPFIAIQRSGVSVSFEDVLDKAKTRRGEDGVLVLEGAGGVAVPFLETQTVALGNESVTRNRVGIVEFAQALDLPMLVVARPGLGTVNHTILTVKYAQQFGIDVLGIVINGHDQESPAFVAENVEMIEFGTGIPVLAVLPRMSDPMAYRQRFVELMQATFR